ncbi:MAG: hypothetical protein ACRER3_23370 [Pseudomonas fluorescens]
MSNKYMVTAWAAVALLALIECINGMSATLHWELVISSPIKMESTTRSTTGWAPIYFIEWTLIQLVLIPLTHEVLRRHADRPRWSRLPSFVGMPEDFNDRFTHISHITMLVSLVTITLYSGGHFFWQTLDADVYCAGKVVIEEPLEHFKFRTGVGDCYLDNKGPGIQFYPRWESWVFLLSYGSAVAAWAWFIVRLTTGDASAPKAKGSKG